MIEKLNQFLRSILIKKWPGFSIKDPGTLVPFLLRLTGLLLGCLENATCKCTLFNMVKAMLHFDHEGFLRFRVVGRRNVSRVASNTDITNSAGCLSRDGTEYRLFGGLLCPSSDVAPRSEIAPILMVEVI